MGGEGKSIKAPSVPSRSIDVGVFNPEKGLRKRPRLDLRGSERNQTGKLQGTQRRGGVGSSARVLGFYSNSVTAASFRPGRHGNAVSRL